MTKTPSPEQISHLLFEADPMNTCCKENDCLDEYDNLAEDILTALNKGDTLENAVRQPLLIGFGEDLATPEKIEQVMRALSPLSLASTDPG
ncbi:hypothetical protein CGX12_09655 [Zobellella denitrificans]|uniref:Uncharacterized protein n=1 Tax=Zobellella denitrificans TaxID=347534 RepID=A0A231MYJ4_9GAMM|nr:hypothetical protein [Zobellella denitrificans]ATG74861.1 hypothetical protein AN401_14170 [Zobellella denitrificans]OXS15303.1 hypothetical protein CGX12_09655 [Zobellella denitrificans]